MKSLFTRRLGRTVRDGKRPFSLRRSGRGTFEMLEERCVLAAATSVGIGAPVLVAFEAAAAQEGTTYTANSTNSAITATVLNTSLLLKMEVQLYDSEGDPSTSGVMSFLLLDDYAPNNIAHIVSLVNTGFYDGLEFFRVVEDFMIQSGDPYNDGTGGSGDGGDPGEVQDDEFSVDLRFTSSGILALANSGPDDNDCQFFVTSDATRWLDFSYTIFGKLVAGDDIREAIESVEVTDNGNDEISLPVYAPTIVSMTVETNTQYGLVMLKTGDGAAVGATSTVTVTASDGSAVVLTASDGSSQSSLSVKAIKDTPSTSTNPAFLKTFPDVEMTAGQSVSFQVPIAIADSGIALDYDSICFDPATGNTVGTMTLSDLGTNGGIATVTLDSSLAGVFGVGFALWRNDDYYNGTYDLQYGVLYAYPAAPSAVSVEEVANGGTVEAGAELTFQITGVLDGATVELYVDDNPDPINWETADGNTVTMYVTADLATGTHTFRVRQYVSYDETIIANRTLEAGELYSALSDSIVTLTVVGSGEALPTAQFDAESVIVADDKATFTVVYSHAINTIQTSTLDGSDILVTGPNDFEQAATLVSYSLEDNGRTVRAVYRVFPSTGAWNDADAGTYTVATVDSQVRDINFNFVEAGVVGMFSVNDASPPTATINQAASQTDPTNTAPIHFTVVFNKPVTGFTAEDVVLSGTAPGTLVAVVTGSGTTYNVAVSGMTGTGTVIASIPAGAADDAEGRPSQAATSSDNLVTFDNAAPTVTINQSSTQGDPTSGPTIDFTVLFSEVVTGFTAADVVLGGTAPGTLTCTVTGSGSTYHVLVSGMTGSGTVTASIPAGAAADAAGNLSLASLSFDNSVSYTMPAPTVTINRAASQADPTNSSTIHFTVVFSQPVTGFTGDDVKLTGTAPGTLTAVVTGSGTTYDVAVSGLTGNGSVTASVPSGVAQNADGTLNKSSTSTDRTVKYDVIAPTVTINRISYQENPTSDSTIVFSVVFSETVEDFETGDVTITGTAPGTLVGVVTGSNRNYRVSVSGMTGSGTVIVNIGAEVAYDTAGNANLASTSTDNVIQYTAPQKTFTITAPTAGSYRLGDNMTIRWKAGGALPGSTISLCLDEDTLWWNGNEKWIQIDQVSAVNGTDTYVWNVAGFKPGTYYVAGYMYSEGTPVFSHLTKPITILAALPATFSLTGPTSSNIALGSNIAIEWVTGSVSGTGTVSLCYDVDGKWNGNEKWIQIDQVAVGNGKASYTWNTTGATPGTYYLGGYVWSGGKATFAYLANRVTIVAPTFRLTGPGAGTYAVGQSITIYGNAANVAAGAKMSLCYDQDTLWNGNEKWIQIDQVSAVNGVNSYKWNTTGLAPGKYYLAGYVWSGNQPAFSRLATPITIIASPFTLTAPAAATTLSAGQSVAIQWNVSSAIPAGSKISLCYDEDATLFNGNEHWITIDKIAATKGTGSYTWNVGDITPGTYYIGGYLYDGATMFAGSHLTQPLTISSPTFNLLGPTSGVFAVGQTIPISWTASNFASGATISLCYDEDTLWRNGNEHWIEIDKVTAVNGTASFSWNTSGVTPGTYYVAGYLFNGGVTFVQSQLTQPITIVASAALTVDAGFLTSGAAETLSGEQLTPIVAEAVQRLENLLGSWVATALSGVEFEIADLSPGKLGEAFGNTVRLDGDAAGYGWFVDATPADDAEFVPVAGSRDLTAASDETAARVDLLTTVMHELGHVLGFDDSAADDLMDALLPLGTRRTAIVDELFASLAR